MKRKLLLSVFFVLVLTSVLAVNAIASNTYTYTDNISAGSTVASLLNETNESSKTWTLYPGLALNDNGSLSVSGLGVSVNYSNSSSYSGYFYKDEIGRFYQFSNCAYTEPSSGTKVEGGAINISSDMVFVTGGYVRESYTNIKIVSGRLVCYGWQSGATRGNYVISSSDGTIYKYHFTGYSGDGSSTDWGYPVRWAGDNYYTWNFRAIPTYTVAFDAQFGQVSPGTAIVISNSTYGILPTPTRSGYTFNGWFTGPGGSGAKINSTDTVVANITLYAAWTINQYSVSFESNGGSIVGSIKQNYGTTVVEPMKPTRSGYTFARWYTDSALTGAASWPLTIGAGDVKLFAAWTTNQYTVSFESNGGSVVAAIKQNYGTTVAEPAKPTLTGYTFAGWYSDEALTGAATWPLTIGVGDVKLFAAWTINQYTVTFESNCGSAVGSIKQNYRTTVAEPTKPTRTGYTFAGWYTDSNLTGAATWPLTIGAGDVKLYAAWAINQYTVSFESDGGSAITSIKQDYGTTVVEPAKPTRSGYTFAGWYSDEALTGEATWPLTIGAGDVKLFAAWTINQYTVSFESNGGSAVGSIKQDYGTTVAEPTKPTRTGYTFASWHMDEALSSAVTWPVTIGADDVKLFAAWTINQYTVSFESNGGSVVAAIKQNYGTTVAEPTKPTRTGYTFASWHMDEALSSAATWPITIGAGDVKLFAAWTINQYTVSFESNGGSVVAAIKQNYGTTVAEPAKPTLTGYTFAGWYSDEALTGAATWPVTIGVGDVKLFAAWTINQYTVTFESNSGSVVTSIKQDYGTTVAEPTKPTRTGYTFAGWYTDSALTGAATWPLTIGAGDVKLYAAWAINQYTVSFESDGGSAITSIKQDYGTTVVEPAKPTRSGYTFAGWYSDEALTGEATWPLTIGAGDVKLFAAWTINQYTVSFESNGDSSVVPISQDFGTTVAEPTAPTRAGYTFTGWYMDSAHSSIATWPLTIGTSNVTLYAKWTVNQYSVSFESNGGSSVTSVKQDFGTTVAESVKPTRTGYTFAGWYADSALTSAVTWPLTIGADNVTLYAKWTANQYSVSFESNGGSAVTSVTQDYGTTVAEPTKPTRSGYSFVGWYMDSELKDAVTWPVTIETENTTLYAAWNANFGPDITWKPNYTVSFDSNDGGELISRNVMSGNKVIEPPTPTKTGYLFDGWYKDSECTIPWNFSDEEVTCSVMLYAKWSAEAPQKRKYTVTFDSNGGNAVPSQMIPKGSVVQPVSNPTMSGYAFAGWYKDTTFAHIWSFKSDVVTTNITLYAKWDAINAVKEDNDNPPAIDTENKPQKGNSIPALIVDSTTDNGDSVNDRESGEIKIPSDNESQGVGNSAPKEDIKANETWSHLWNAVCQLAKPAAAVVLFILLCVLITILAIKEIRIKRVCFYDTCGEVCTAWIRGNKINITNAISQASGTLLKVKLSDRYVEKRQGRHLKFYYNGAQIGTMAVDDEGCFDIDIR